MRERVAAVNRRDQVAIDRIRGRRAAATVQRMKRERQALKDAKMAKGAAA